MTGPESLVNADANGDTVKEKWPKLSFGASWVNPENRSRRGTYKVTKRSRSTRSGFKLRYLSFLIRPMAASQAMDEHLVVI